MHSSDSEFIVREDNAVYETDTPVLYSVAEGIATLTLNRPNFNNAQNSQMTYALDAALREAVNDDSVKVIVLRGNGKIIQELEGVFRGAQWNVTKVIRSEERRVGKECRSRWSPYH